MTYKIDFTSDKAERFFYDLYHAYQWSEDSFKDGDLKRNIINTAVFGETVKSLRLFGAVTECGNYNDNGFDRIGFAKVNGYTMARPSISVFPLTWLPRQSASTRTVLMLRKSSRHPPRPRLLQLPSGTAPWTSLTRK